MSEVSQEINTSIDPEASPQRARPKRFSNKKQKPNNREREQENREGCALLCDSWKIPNKQRLQIGFVGLAFVFPFVSLSLVYPEWTGHIGTRLSLGLFSFFGQAALLVPLVTLYLVLSCAGFRSLRKTRVLFLLPLMVCLVGLTERWAQSGGWLGEVLDKALVAALGPGGAWLIIGTLLSLTTVAFFPRLKDELSHLTGLMGEHFHETRLRMQQWRLTPNKKKTLITEVAQEPQEPVLSEKKPEETEQNAAPLVEETKADKPLFLSTEAPEPENLDSPVSVPPSPRAKPTARQAIREEDACPNLFAKKPAPPAEVSVEDSLDHTTLIDTDVPHIPSPPPAPVVKNSPTDSPNIVRFADSAEIEDSLELEKPKLTKSDEAQAAIPRARHFELPPLVLLDEIPQAARRKPSEDKSQALLEALDAFGVKAKLLQIVRGPAVTRYELQPARGVKVSKFTSLTKDIALALASTAVRIEAPIPGKSAIGIEIPNKHTDLVVLKDIIRDTIFTDSKGLTVALGKDLSGRPVVTDLQKMPHLLVAGTTGSGKSVCVNGLIISLLYRFTPDQLQIMMVDPKQVELSVYEDIPHLVGFSDNEKGEIIVDPKKAAQALHQVVCLMEERYKLFADNKVRNLAEYNQKFEEEPIPWFVVIIDELADLMMVASKSVETSICRIAQKARAAGIHLVLATQRPSADVLTGLIKVNIPSRAAFAVSSQVDSRVILDTGGAEHLLGKGDMLFLPVDASDPKRLQGSYVGNEEIARIVEFWKGQGLPENRIEFELQEDILAEDDNDEEPDADDALLQEALRVVLNRKQASASMFQTELKVGYARARRLLIAMEKKGWVGPPEGSKPRKILYTGPLPDDASPEA